jgi:hypothetical protein
MTATVDPLELRLLYSPQDPEPPQHAFLLLDELETLEAFYGGAAGGGKSSALLMAALRYVDIPNYAAILFRKTFTELALPEALIARSHEWLAGSDARWNGGDYRWTFPSGATLSFGYLQSKNDRYRYQGAAFQFIGFDEATHFDEDEYRYLFTRLRRPSGIADDHPLSRVPLRMRAASNPGGRGHKWVKRRFIDRLPDEDNPEDTPEKCRARVFIPARLQDNPHLDQEAYIASLSEVDPELRAQMLEGDWDAGNTGDVFARYKHGDYRLGKAAELGRDLDRQLAAGTLPPPAGGRLCLGIDWGEHTGYAIGWPLEAGGIYVPVAGELVAHEPGQAFDVIVDDQLQWVAERAWPIMFGRPMPRDADPLELLEFVSYDAAGISSMRTFMAKARKRRPRLRSVKVSFGAPAPGPGEQRSFKREAIGYLRRLAKRVNDAERAGVIAFGRRAAELTRQATAIAWADPDRGTIAKGDDHVFDALIALVSPIARRHRA